MPFNWDKMKKIQIPNISLTTFLQPYQVFDLILKYVQMKVFRTFTHSSKLCEFILLDKITPVEFANEDYFNSPQEYMEIFCDDAPLRVPHFSIFRTTSAPLMTCPNTTCFPSSQSVL